MNGRSCDRTFREGRRPPRCGLRVATERPKSYRARKNTKPASARVPNGAREGASSRVAATPEAAAPARLDLAVGSQEACVPSGTRDARSRSVGVNAAAIGSYGSKDRTHARQMHRLPRESVEAEPGPCRPRRRRAAALRGDGADSRSRVKARRRLRDSNRPRGRTGLTETTVRRSFPEPAPQGVESSGQHGDVLVSLNLRRVPDNGNATPRTVPADMVVSEGTPGFPTGSTWSPGGIQPQRSTGLTAALCPSPVETAVAPATTAALLGGHGSSHVSWSRQWRWRKRCSDRQSLQCHSTTGDRPSLQTHARRRLRNLRQEV